MPRCGNPYRAECRHAPIREWFWWWKIVALTEFTIKGLLFLLFALLVLGFFVVGA